MSTLTQILDRALAYHQGGKISHAAALYREILTQSPDHAQARHLLGVTYQQTGCLREAVDCIRQAIALDQSRSIFHNNLGVALRGLGYLREAEQALRQAIAIQPRYADAYSNLAVTLHELGQPQSSLAAFESALRLQPDHADAHFNCGNLLQDMGRPEEAIHHYEQAVAVRPERAEAYNNLGNALLNAARPDEALRCYERAIRLAPDYAEAHMNLGTTYAEQERLEEAAESFKTAAQLRPDRPLWKLRFLGLCPSVFSEGPAISQFRERLESHLDAAAQTPLKLDVRTLTADAFTPSFYLSHHGHNNRRLKEKFAALYAPHFPRVSPPRRPQGKLRIGFLVTQKHEGGFLRCMTGVLQRLNRKRFQPVVLCSEGVLLQCRGTIRREDVEYVGVPHRFDLAAERIKAAQCDLLYHWQIGTDPLNYLLPFARLAPVQCTGWGTHGTTGIAAVDYYLSSRLIEAPDAQEHYTESLYLFETFPTWQKRPPRPPRPAARSDFGLPTTGSLYLAPHRLQKIHPDMDPLLDAILDADPRGWVVLLQGNRPQAAALLRERFARTLGRAAERVIFLPAQGVRDFRRLLTLGDVLLDAPHYSASLIGHDALELDLPLVTLPGEFNVGRYVLGFYRRMGLEQFVAATPEQYVALAVRLGTDRECRESWRAILSERKDVLFEDHRAVADHEQFFAHAISNAI